MSQQQWVDRHRSAVMDTYGPPQLVLERGEGAWVWDVDGNRYLDLLAGIAVNALGHAHPALVKAVSEQVATLGARLQLLRHDAAGAAGRAAAGAARRRATTAGSSSPTRAPRPTRRRSS